MDESEQIRKKARTDKDPPQEGSRSTKSKLPEGFFDSNEEKHPITKYSEDDDEDEEWAAFQAELAQGEAEVDEGPTTTISQQNAAVIEAQPVASRDPPGAEEQDQDQDQYQEDDEAENDITTVNENTERTLREFEKQQELYQRVERMKQLKEQKRSGVSKLNTGGGEKKSENGNAQENDEEDEDEYDEQDVWS